ncbi:MAG: hypothetical protein CVU39_24180 [Chloroflexi bacterium HGW-Chloroflexi-10]|nr:MAG: hypothetical protein CVU39_24180 [Chloroflexi bacterium HGW-Chloroflexi-10]
MTYMDKLLIVNADDYGLTPGVSAGIRQVHLSGIVTSTTAMMNRPKSVEALKIAQQDCPLLGLGVHLVLTSGNPILPAQRIPSLVKPGGSFFSYPEFLTHLDKVNPDEAMAEWRSQVELFIASTGHTPDHLDSHHHASYFTPALFERMLTLAQELNCPIRNPFGEGGSSFEDYLPSGTTQQITTDMTDLFNRYHPLSTQIFLSTFYDKNATLENLKSILTTIADDPHHHTFELMCHPAIIDEDLQQISSYYHQRAVERIILESSDLGTLLRLHKIRLINFSSLTH